MDRSDLRNRLFAILYPARCVYCGAVTAPGANVCADCAPRRMYIGPPVCPYCGCSRTDCTCGHKHRAYAAIIAPFYYEGPVQQAIHRLKFSGKTGSAPVLAYEMATIVRREYEALSFDLIVCVPMEKNKQRARGYNQSALLAHALAEELGLPCAEGALVKQYETSEQHFLTADERRGNVLGVFDVPDRSLVEGRCVLLCDDIKTTGTTLHECAKTLRAAGAREVFAVCAAITPLRRQP